MTDFDPVEMLSSINDVPVDPDTSFSSELLGRLLDELAEPERDKNTKPTVAPLVVEPDQGRNLWILGAVAAAAVVALIAVGLFVRAGMGDRDVIVDTPPAPTTTCLLYTSPSPRDRQKSRMPSSA